MPEGLQIATPDAIVIGIAEDGTFPKFRVEPLLKATLVPAAEKSIRISIIPPLRLHSLCLVDQGGFEGPLPESSVQLEVDPSTYPLVAKSAV